jgi:glutathione S-transferase
VTLKFYFAPMSTASLTEAVLAELGVPYEGIQLDISAGETRRPDYLAINPNGRVPTIVHDGTVIWESGAIAMYLGETFGVAQGLYPAAGPKRGEAMKWIVWSVATLGEAAGRLSAALPSDVEGGVQSGSQDWVAPEQRSAAALEKASQDVAACLSILNNALAEQKFLLGDYSLVDTHVHGLVGWLGMMGTNLSAYAHIGAWLSRCAARPALARFMQG